MKTKYVAFLGLLGLISCSSNQYGVINEDSAVEKIIQRSDELSSRPDWVKESVALTNEKGQLFSLGMTEIYADQKIDAAYRIAENSAKVSFSKTIEQKLESFFQVGQEGMDSNQEQTRYLSSEVSKMTTSGISVSNRYWEKILTQENSGNKVIKYRVFVRVSIPEATLKEQTFLALKKARGEKSSSKEFQDAMDKKWQENF